MSFQHATYVKALAAIEDGDEARAMTLIHRPVETRHAKRCQQLQLLLRQSARQGLTQASDHFLALLPAGQVRSNVLGVWALAVEHGHETMAAAWRQKHAAHFVSWGEAYAEALTQDAWRANLRLLDEHPDLGMERANWTVDHLVRKLLRPTPEAAYRLLLRVADAVNPARWSTLAILAMRSNDETLLDACLPKNIQQDRDPRKYAEILWREALAEQRYDWVSLIEARMDFHPQPQVWAPRLAEAVSDGRHGIVLEVLTQRPELVEHLAAPQYQRSWGQVVSALLEHVDNQDLRVVSTHRQMWAILTRHVTPQAVRDHFDTTQELGSLDRSNALNALVLLVPAEIGQAWIESEPDLFAPAIPRFRDQQAQACAPQTHTRRARVRA